MRSANTWVTLRPASPVPSASNLGLPLGPRARTRLPSGDGLLGDRRREKFDYTTHEKLKEAIERQLFEERRDTIKLTISARSPDTEQVRKLNDVVETLIAREGYCSECANELLKYVSSLLAREK